MRHTTGRGKRSSMLGLAKSKYSITLSLVLRSPHPTHELSGRMDDALKKLADSVMASLSGDHMPPHSEALMERIHPAFRLTTPASFSPGSSGANLKRAWMQGSSHTGQTRLKAMACPLSTAQELYAKEMQHHADVAS